MFDETDKYKNWGHFFFSKGNKLPELTKTLPDLPGVYYIAKLAKGRIKLVYIGHADSLKDQILNGRINITPEGKTHQGFFDLKFSREDIDALDIYWFVTRDKKHDDDPEMVMDKLMQQHFDLHGNLPDWVEDF